MCLLRAVVAIGIMLRTGSFAQPDPVQELEDGTHITFGCSRNGFTNISSSNFRFDSTEPEFMSLSWSEKQSQLIAWRTTFDDMQNWRRNACDKGCRRAIVHMMLPDRNSHDSSGKKISAGQTVL